MSGTASEDALQALAAELYAAPPEDFVTARDAAARRARADGQRDLAAEVAGLRRPTTAAWAVNQVVRADPGVITDLRDLGARMRHAQAALDATGLTALRPLREEVLARYLAAVRDACRAGGHAPTPGVEAEARDTAVAALADASAEEAAWSGTLTRALQYSGFGEVDVTGAVARTSTGVLLRQVRTEGEGTGQDDGAAGRPRKAEVQREAAKRESAERAERETAERAEREAAERERREREDAASHRLEELVAEAARLQDRGADLDDRISRLREELADAQQDRAQVTTELAALAAASEQARAELAAARAADAGG